jgi:hypothetical protein
VSNTYYFLKNVSSYSCSSHETDITKIYRGKSDFVESMTDIYHALAAKSISDIGSQKDLAQGKDDPAAKVVEYLRKAEQHMRMNEYTWLLKGFFELKQGSIVETSA